MKMVEITFFTRAKCSKLVFMDDDSELSTSDSTEFWTDVCENNPEFFLTNLIDDNVLDGCESDDFWVHTLDFERFESIVISDNNDNVICKKQFDNPEQL